MIKHFCDLCESEAPKIPSSVNLFVKVGRSIEYWNSKTLCEACANSLAEWSESRIKLLKGNA